MIYLSRFEKTQKGLKLQANFLYKKYLSYASQGKKELANKFLNSYRDTLSMMK